MYQKTYVKIVDFALKKFKEKESNIAKQKAEYEAKQERIEKRRAKRQAYKERRAVKREHEEKEKQIEIQKEAYIRAMEYLKEKK